MNLQSFTNEQLDQNLRALQQDRPRELDQLEQTVQELQVHQIELEMHNRALREAQAELELSVQRYTDLYDNLPLAYLTLTPSGQIVSANRAATEQLKCDRRGLAGSYFGIFFDSYDAGRLSAHLEHCARHGFTGTIELTLRPKAGEAVAVQLSSRPASDRGTEPHLHVAIADISKLKTAQTVLEEINREQDAFNYSISHDLRAPLVTINNYAAIILADYGDKVPEDGRAMITRIRGAAIRMEETLKHLLEYSVVARQEVVLEAVDVERIVRDLLIEHRALVEQCKATIALTCPLGKVRASPALLGQVISNLLTNALKYTPPDTPARVEIRAEANGKHVTLQVIDRGIGIDPKYHARIFNLFERLHGYSHYPGSGVGLSIARRAVERMNGRIWVQSKPGEGSCFCVELPAAVT